MFKRENYLSLLRSSYDTKAIKILVGMRGSGKSTLISQIIDELKENYSVDEFHIFYINFEFLENQKIKTPKKLNSFIRKKISSKDLYYFFFDEISLLPQFETVFGDILDEFSNISIFITSSNTRCLKEDLNPILAHKYRAFYITPFSYCETCSFLKTEPKNKTMLLNYLKYGGLPGRLLLKKSSEVKKFLYSNLDSIYLRDIVMRLGIQDINDINCIMKYIIKYLGKDFYIPKIQEDLLENNEEIPENKLLTNIDSLRKSLMISGAPAYNVHTDSISYNTPRYYLNDLGLGFIFGLDVSNNMDAVLKNLVYIELKNRGYEVYTGINLDKKFDFVAVRYHKIMYLHIAYLLEDGNSINHEIEKLSNFDFNGKRYLITMNREDLSRKGIIHKYLIDFLEEIDLECEMDKQSWHTVE